jgi:hypothetical protein
MGNFSSTNVTGILLKLICDEINEIKFHSESDKLVGPAFVPVTGSCVQCC